jgi:hypothetical protein
VLQKAKNTQHPISRTQDDLATALVIHMSRSFSLGCLFLFNLLLQFAFSVFFMIAWGMSLGLGVGASVNFGF